jgi:hypothetical protein
MGRQAFFAPSAKGICARRWGFRKTHLAVIRLEAAPSEEQVMVKDRWL